MPSRPDHLGPRPARPADAPPPGPGRRRAPASGFRRPTRSEVLLVWAPSALGVAVALVIVTAVTVTRGSGAAGPAPRASIDYAWTPPVADYTPAVAISTRAPSPTLPPPNTLPPLSPSSKPTTAKPRTTPPPPPPPVTGRYSVVDGYRGGFIGEVLVTNPTANPRDWTVRLEFPRDVGRLYTFWVEGAPPPELDRPGDAYVFTSRAPVAARGKVALRFQFERWGRDIDPTTCSVNNTPCVNS
ncbi:hypothetical protein GCM10022251_57390 [Phytohabitans flavus]|uniref:CBM2 domain-containing protein n=1 Tax=Phytohabitans flavus TaxID=1076124 RepID=A0A6F8XTM3_9ACTN|nr:cellulose-binding protein [Phytohabitans flavus]BCB77170.1 hypothetical protein Pflav_035800 [Phytohabitans flavus]